MFQASFHFFAELNDFFPLNSRGKTSIVYFEGNPSVKHLIEAEGVPHPEVAAILANGRPVDFSYLVQDRDQVEVYPVSAGSLSLIQDEPTGERRFILDNHLGRLAVYLRMLGLDTLYRNDYQDEELAQVAGQEGRILLTRDVRLLMRNLVTYGYWVRSLLPREQLGEVVRRFKLSAGITPFQRCLRCNTPLKVVKKDEVLDRLEPLTRLYYNEFHICPRCKQIYWKGSHYDRMQQLIRDILGEE
jgi:uncharacterized protein with PIN domain